MPFSLHLGTHSGGWDRSFGHSFVDESASPRVDADGKITDDNVFAGFNQPVRRPRNPPERIGRDTSYGKIIEAVEHAERSRAPVQSWPTGWRISRLLRLVPGAHYLITRDIVSTISVIIVAGACA